MRSSLTHAVHRLSLHRDRRLRLPVLTAAVLLLATALVSLGVVRPLSARLEDQREKNARMRSDISTAILFEQQRKGSGSIVAIIPTQKDMPLLVKELVQQARKGGLSVGSVDYEIPRSGGGGLSKLAFRFPVAGRYPDLKRFIFELETSGRMIGIEELELRSGRSLVELDLKLVTYVRAQ